MKLYKYFPTPLVFIYLAILFSIPSVAQVGINTVNPKASLDVQSTDSGILIPRVALSATNISSPIVEPETSELIYNTATAGTGPNSVRPGFYYWNGSQWVGLSAGSPAGGDDKWDLLGNAETNPGTNFIGTTDAKALHFKTNNTTRLIIPSDNQIHAHSRGTEALPFFSFLADPATGFYSPAPNFLGFSTGATRRFLIGNDRIISYQNHRFADGTNSSPAITFLNKTNMGLYNAGSNTMGFSTSGVERIRISDAGLGINLYANPTERLHVNGNIRFDGALKPNNIAGNPGQVLISAGQGQAPTWGPDMSNISRIVRYEIGPHNFSAHTDYSLTVTVPGVKPHSTVIVNIRGPWLYDIFDDITIHNIEIRDGEIRIAISNYASSPYQNLILNLTVIQ